MLKETQNDDLPLYAKIGCQHRGTYTSTKLQLNVYTDKQCSQPYDEQYGEVKNDGYDLNGYFLSNKVRERGWKRPVAWGVTIANSLQPFSSNNYSIRYPSVHPSTAAKAASPRKSPTPSRSSTRVGTTTITSANRVRSVTTTKT